MFRFCVLWIRRLVRWVRCHIEVARQVSRQVTLTPKPLHDELAEALGLLRTLPKGQTGAISALALESIFVGIVLLIVLIQFLLQQGLPELIRVSNNTTALVAAGADASTITWVSFISKVVVIFLLIGVLVIGIRVALAGKGGGGGGGHRSHRRR